MYEACIERTPRDIRIIADPTQLQRAESFATFRLGNVHAFHETEQLLVGAIVQARERGETELIVDITGLTGFAPPTLSARHSLARTWAAASQGQVRLAVVARSAFVDPQKFGVVAAANFGLHGDVFVTEAEAVAWLREPGQGGRAAGRPETACRWEDMASLLQRRCWPSCFWR